MSEEQLRALATEKWFMDEGVLHVEQLAKAGIFLSYELSFHMEIYIDLRTDFHGKLLDETIFIFWVSMAATCFCNLIHMK
jgi:hypothetical protein